MRPLLLFLYRQSFSIQQRQQSKGFTLLELLISLVVASIVVAGLLYGVVELTTIDRREANLDQVQRDMNRAMEYITDDLQEAVYVYTNPQAISAQLAADPAFPGDTGEVPVLAFWRIDPIEDNLPTCNAAAANFRECELLRIRQAAYTLVVYVQKVNDGNANWSGQSRIIRYELSKYSNIANLTPRGGYRDPTNPTGDDNLAAFEVWQPDGVAAGSSAVLVDYVQAPNLPLNRSPLSDAGGACRGYGLDANNLPLYAIVPTTATTTDNNSFFSCVRNPNVGGGATRANQDIYVFLRGNVQSFSGGGSSSYNAEVRGYSDETSLPILETQVLIKGVIDKGFNQ